MKPYRFAIPLLLFVALRFAQPIEDGDLFWHMKYGSQMLERGTLRTDHCATPRCWRCSACWRGTRDDAACWIAPKRGWRC